MKVLIGVYLVGFLIFVIRMVFWSITYNNKTDGNIDIGLLIFSVLVWALIGTLWPIVVIATMAYGMDKQNDTTG